MPVEPVPTTVFGLAAYNGEAHLAEAIESLLSQTRSDLAVVIVDDASTDSTGEISARYVHHDSRVSYARNDRQLGLSRNWQRAFELAGERHPAARYFAWASDHDVWGPRWHERVAAELEAHDEAVLAYPLAVRVDDAGSEYPTRERLFDTAGLVDPHERVRCVAGELRGAGELVYGLLRRSAVERSGPFPVAMLADRLFLVRLALEGEFHQVRERLWYRRFRAGVRMSNARQRRAAFPEGAPPSAYVPW
ncbi:MAG TPA: glycosyltransferase family 2 protein, partial [Gaiellaceae bacterium]|nr:glycosyltransferase family 2 protein [Gaiellaceae bacterium]